MIAKPTSDAILSSAASTASSSFVASRPATRKPPELTSRCYASQQQGSGSKLSTRPSALDHILVIHALGFSHILGVSRRLRFAGQQTFNLRETDRTLQLQQLVTAEA